MEEVCTYVENVIVSFESGLYKMVEQKQPDRLELLADPQQPFITIFRDLHENYFTSTYGSIVKRTDTNINDKFNALVKTFNHNARCILNILANLTASVHFNLERSKLRHQDIGLYLHSLKEQVRDLLSYVNISELFNHKCDLNYRLEPMNAGQKFITICMTTKTNGVENELVSFT